MDETLSNYRLYPSNCFNVNTANLLRAFVELCDQTCGVLAVFLLWENKIDLCACMLVFPVRVQYCSQEIIIIREDLVNKMCRNCVRLPNDNHDIPNHVGFHFL